MSRYCSNSLAKNVTRTGIQWFTINAHAFHTQICEGQDGYTILWVPEEPSQMTDNHLNNESEREGTSPTLKHGYILWEFSNTYPMVA